jgi:hypothetical protein
MFGVFESAFMKANEQVLMCWLSTIHGLFTYHNLFTTTYWAPSSARTCFKKRLFNVLLGDESLKTISFGVLIPKHMSPR